MNFSENTQPGVHCCVLRLISCLCLCLTVAFVFGGCTQQTHWVPHSGVEAKANVIESAETEQADEANDVAQARMRTWRIQSRLDQQADAFASLGETKRFSNELQVKLSDIQFKTNSAELLPQSNELLKKFAAILCQFPEDFVVVSGHTDSDGGNSHNLQLSKARAKAVADALILHGVGTESITAKGYGENKPIASNETAEGKAINRRVELGITVDGFRVADR